MPTELIGFSRPTAERLKRLLLDAERSGVFKKTRTRRGTPPVIVGADTGALYARITGKSGQAYSWIEVEPHNTQAGAFQDKTGGRSGTANAYEINDCSANIQVGDDNIVKLFPSFKEISGTLYYWFDKGLTDENSSQRYVFTPTGQAC